MRSARLPIVHRLRRAGCRPGCRLPGLVVGLLLHLFPPVVGVCGAVRVVWFGVCAVRRKFGPFRDPGATFWIQAVNVSGKNR